MRKLRYKIFDNIVMTFVTLGFLGSVILMSYLMYQGIPDDSPYWLLVDWIQN